MSVKTYYPLNNIIDGILRQMDAGGTVRDKIHAIKIVRSITGMGLKECKEAVEAGMERAAQADKLVLQKGVDCLRTILDAMYDENYCADAACVFSILENNQTLLNQFIVQVDKVIQK